jgi:Fe-S cluster biogenesis protein NfuA
VEQRIRDILDAEIRRRWRRTAGDITLDRFENGHRLRAHEGLVQRLPLVHGDAEDGIEGRLRESIPEVAEVVAV